MKILGLSCYYHDAAAVLLSDGNIIAAAAEERFTRIKHDTNFPKKAIEWCLQYTQVPIEEIDVVAFYEKPVLKFERIVYQHLQTFPSSAQTFIDTMPAWLQYRLQLKQTLKKTFGYTGAIEYYKHHLSHAASSFFPSKFTKAAILTLDGVGEWDTTTIGEGNERGVQIHKSIRFPHSLGLLYSTITGFLGFSINDAEYKVMGLSAFGNPNYYRDHFKQLISIHEDGSFRLNLKYFSFISKNRMHSTAMTDLFKMSARKATQPVTEIHAHIAASLQQQLEHCVFTMATKLHKKTKSKNLCLAGGVALNAAMNGKILRNTPFTNLYIPPDPGDAGGAMGAAFLSYYSKTKKTSTFLTPYLGPDYSDNQIETVIQTIKKVNTQEIEHIKYSSTNKLCEFTIHALMEQKIVGWFQGRMEWGPRALGNRSILADPRDPLIKDIINTKVKHREPFRPFAPAVLEDQVSTLFYADSPLPDSTGYMLHVYPLKPKGKKLLQAATHVDNTGRLQTIRKKDTPLFYDLVDGFYKKTGVPAILNTSFNVQGEPIVACPRDAIYCFLSTDIDILVIGSHVLIKK